MHYVSSAGRPAEKMRENAVTRSSGSGARMTSRVPWIGWMQASEIACKASLLTP